MRVAAILAPSKTTVLNTRPTDTTGLSYSLNGTVIRYIDPDGCYALVVVRLTNRGKIYFVKCLQPWQWFSVPVGRPETRLFPSRSTNETETNGRNFYRGPLI